LASDLDRSTVDAQELRVVAIFDLVHVVDPAQEVLVLEAGSAAGETVAVGVHDIDDVAGPRVVANQLDQHRPPGLVTVQVQAGVDGRVVGMLRIGEPVLSRASSSWATITLAMATAAAYDTSPAIGGHASCIRRRARSGRDPAGSCWWNALRPARTARFPPGDSASCLRVTQR
jgi:hypothetical protein